MKLIFLPLCICLVANKICAQPIGHWSMLPTGLPAYHYTGSLPFKAVDKQGNDAVLPADPYFLLGNYRMTLITHASGIYQLMTAERAWARLNAGDQPNYGWNDASITLKKGRAQKKIVLTGINSISANPDLVQKTFGPGFACYQYQLENAIACTRVISVKPSGKINTGNPSFLISINLKNNSTRKQEINYSERMRARFVMNGTQFIEPEQRKVKYTTGITISNDKQAAIAAFTYQAVDLLMKTEKNQRAVYDIHPPAVFMSWVKTGDDKAFTVSADHDTLSAGTSITLLPGATRSFQIAIGVVDGSDFSDVNIQLDDLLQNSTSLPAEYGIFASQWKAKLPDLSGEKDELLKREMLWNAHMIEASAKYSGYYQETFIPQGTVYSYHFGDNISNRDHLQALLPACYTNPALAKSAIRYVVKHSESDGEIKRGNSGFGYTPPSIYKESDEQLYFFNTVAEYLLITKDFDFLNEQLTFYPAEYGKKDALINILSKYFIYLRDEVGRGPNGLVKMLNSDWSDSFFHEYSPDKYAGSAESHLNSAMVLAIFPKLIEALKLSRNESAASLIIALQEYHDSLEKAFMKDLGERKFSARAYLGSKLKFGLDDVCIEPQGYLLQIPGLPVARKKEIYEYVKSKLLTPEKIGIRTREAPLWKGKPEGEDGGIWYSLEYPFLLGVASFDKAEARRLLKLFSFQNFATHYPDYWIGHWTAPDEINSTLYREGLYSFWVSVPDLKQAFQGYCSHPHAWPLFCYFKLKEMNEQ